MSLFRGARYLISLGHHALKSGQQSIVLLQATSSCQMVLKQQRLFNTKALHMNKLDLSGIGILTHASLFSTESGYSEISDNDTEQTTDDERTSLLQQLGCRQQLPAPQDRSSIDTPRKIPPSKKTVHVGFNMRYDETQLQDLLSQFGKVVSIDIPQRFYNNKTSTDLGYAFVTFSNENSFRKALEAGQVTTPEGEILKINKRNKYTTGEEIKRTFVAYGLPYNVNVQQVCNYFESFGNVELVNLYLNVPLKLDGVSVTHNFAFIVFENNSDFILSQDHQIGDSGLTVKKVRNETRRLKRYRCKIISLEGLPRNITKDEIASYFRGIGHIEFISILTSKQTGEPNGLGVVQFRCQNDAHSAAENLLHEIAGSSVKVRVLGYLNEK